MERCEALDGTRFELGCLRERAGLDGLDCFDELDVGLPYGVCAVFWEGGDSMIVSRDGGDNIIISLLVVVWRDSGRLTFCGSWRLAFDRFGGGSSKIDLPRG